MPPAQLALATILQAYTKVSDDEVIEATVMDRRWQMALDCMGAEEPPFSKGTLVFEDAYPTRQARRPHGEISASPLVAARTASVKMPARPPRRSGDVRHGLGELGLVQPRVRAAGRQ